MYPRCYGVDIAKNMSGVPGQTANGRAPALADQAGQVPRVPGDRCHFPAINLDDEDWREDARALFKTCQQNSPPAALEISRLGNAAHLWLFFAPRSQPARTRQLKLASYDRLIPNEDTMPKGGSVNRPTPAGRARTLIDPHDVVGDELDSQADIADHVFNAANEIDQQCGPLGDACLVGDCRACEPC